MESNIIIRETESALLVSTSALNKDFVWVVEKGKAAKKYVKLGTRGVPDTEVLSGLDIHDLVVTNSSLEIEDGQSLKTNLVSK